MRKLFYLISILLLMSCSGNKHIYTETAQIIDYEKYNNKGFFITESNSVSFDYTPIGSIVVRIYSGHEVVGTEYVKKFKSTGTYTEIPKMRVGDWRNGDLEDAFIKLHKEAISRGANGVINLKYELLSTFPVNTREIATITGQLIRK